MKRELKPAEREEIVAAVAAGDRVKATSIYLSATEGNLTEAQNFIKALMEERALNRKRARFGLQPKSDAGLAMCAIHHSAGRGSFPGCFGW